MPVTVYQMQNGQLVQLDLGGAAVTVDSALSSTSTNPVQNQAIYAALEDKADAADIPDLTSINITLEEPTGGSSVTQQIDLTQDFTLYLPDDYAPLGHTHDFSAITTHPTTLAGYGITDAKIVNGVITLGSNTITPLTSHQDISGKADVSDLANYLPLSGGNMTGAIKVTSSDQTAFWHTHTNGTSMRFGVGSGGENRGIYQGPGNSHYDGWLLYWDGNGNFGLRTENNGTAGKALAGNPTGNLTWGGSAVALSDDCYLLGSTNTVTTGNLIIRDAAGSFVRISGGSAINKGANLLLYGESHTSNAGRFYIYCNDGTTTKNLNGTVGGTLQWNGQTVQTSSDERLKTAFSEVPDEILDAWGKVNWQQFKFIEDAERKGIENCRWHPGLVAQRVKAVFEAEGLDACKYGILCHEVWQDEYDEEGETLIRETGDQWYIRYEEALAMEAIYQRRRADRLEERITRLEALLDGDLK